MAKKLTEELYPDLEEEEDLEKEIAPEEYKEKTKKKIIEGKKEILKKAPKKVIKKEVPKKQMKKNLKKIAFVGKSPGLRKKSEFRKIVPLKKKERKIIKKMVSDLVDDNPEEFDEIVDDINHIPQSPDVITLPKINPQSDFSSNAQPVIPVIPSIRPPQQNDKITPNKISTAGEEIKKELVEVVQEKKKRLWFGRTSKVKKEELTINEKIVSVGEELKKIEKEIEKTDKIPTKTRLLKLYTFKSQIGMFLLLTLIIAFIPFFTMISGIRILWGFGFVFFFLSPGLAFLFIYIFTDTEPEYDIKDVEYSVFNGNSINMKQKDFHIELEGLEVIIE